MQTTEKQKAGNLLNGTFTSVRKKQREIFSDR
jgi:hypothetical protein